MICYLFAEWSSELLLWLDAIHHTLLGSNNVCSTTNNYILTSLPPHFGEVLANQSISYGNCKSTIIVKWWLNSHPWCMYIVYYGNSTDWINGSRSPGCQILKLRASGNHELLFRVERAPPVKIKWSVRYRGPGRPPSGHKFSYRWST